MAWKLPNMRIATILSVLAIVISASSHMVSKLPFGLSATKDQREISEQLPAVDLQIIPAGAAPASVTISVRNRGDVNVAPQDITVPPSLEQGEFYFAGRRPAIAIRAVGTRTNGSARASSVYQARDRRARSIWQPFRCSSPGRSAYSTMPSFGSSSPAWNAGSIRTVASLSTIPARLRPTMT